MNDKELEKVSEVLKSIPPGTKEFGYIDIDHVEIVDRPKWGKVVKFTLDNQPLFVSSVRGRKRNVLVIFVWNEEYSCFGFFEKLKIPGYRVFTRYESLIENAE